MNKKKILYYCIVIPSWQPHPETPSMFLDIELTALTLSTTKHQGGGSFRILILLYFIYTYIYIQYGHQMPGQILCIVEF